MLRAHVLSAINICAVSNLKTMCHFKLPMAPLLGLFIVVNGVYIAAIHLFVLKRKRIVSDNLGIRSVCTS